MTTLIIFLILMIIILIVLVSCVRIVPQANALVVERLGAYLGTWHVGVHFLLPFVDRVGLERAGSRFCPPASDYQG